MIPVFHGGAFSDDPTEAEFEKIPPVLQGFNGPLCEDPLCYRSRPHFVREYGCRWSDVAIDHPNGTRPFYKAPSAGTKLHHAFQISFHPVL